MKQTKPDGRERCVLTQSRTRADCAVLGRCDRCALLTAGKKRRGEKRFTSRSVSCSAVEGPPLLSLSLSRSIVVLVGGALPSFDRRRV